MTYYIRRRVINFISGGSHSISGATVAGALSYVLSCLSPYCCSLQNPNIPTNTPPNCPPMHNPNTITTISNIAQLARTGPLFANYFIICSTSKSCFVEFTSDGNCYVAEAGGGGSEYGVLCCSMELQLLILLLN